MKSVEGSLSFHWKRGSNSRHIVETRVKPLKEIPFFSSSWKSCCVCVCVCVGMRVGTKEVKVTVLIIIIKHEADFYSKSLVFIHLQVLFYF